MEVQLQTLMALALLTLSLLSGAAHSAKFSFTNKCSFTVWPGTLTGIGAQLSSTGFELAPMASFSLDVPPGWSGRFWARTQCSSDPSGKFTCATGDCGSGQVACNGAGAVPPATLLEFTLVPNSGQLDFYDTSLVDGFNLPVSVVPQGGTGVRCTQTGCPANVNAACPTELAVKAGSAVVACKSACNAFNTPQYCCTGEFGTPDKCPPSTYSKLFKGQCPQAYSYAYDDKSSTFACSGAPNYAITFCP